MNSRFAGTPPRLLRVGEKALRLIGVFLNPLPMPQENMPPDEAGARLNFVKSKRPVPSGNHG